MTSYSWIDPATGHNVVRLSRVDPGCSSSFYFTQNPFTAARDKMVFIHDDKELYCLDISKAAEFGSGKATPLAQTEDFVAMPVVGPVSREVYYINGNGRNISATNLDTLKTRIVAPLPSDWDLATESISGLTLNSDETLLAGVETKGLASAFQAGKSRMEHIDAAYKAHLPSLIFTVDTKTGKISEILHGNDWFNHAQFSPADPFLLMFCHEGNWRQVDRIWLIHADGSGLTNVHPRKVPGETYTHEFWGPDGKTIWSDHADGKSRTLAGKNIISGEEMGYRLADDQDSRHYNISHDGKFFAGDGEPTNPHPAILLLIPQSNGTLLTKPLSSIAKNNFGLEPNVSFFPNDKWVIFSSNQTGAPQAYAVQVTN